METMSLGTIFFSVRFGNAVSHRAPITYACLSSIISLPSLLPVEESLRPLTFLVHPGLLSSFDYSLTREIPLNPHLGFSVCTWTAPFQDLSYHLWESFLCSLGWHLSDRLLCIMYKFSFEAHYMAEYKGLWILILSSLLTTHDSKEFTLCLSDIVHSLDPWCPTPHFMEHIFW